MNSTLSKFAVALRCKAGQNKDLLLTQFGQVQKMLQRMGFLFYQHQSHFQIQLLELYMGYLYYVILQIKNLEILKIRRLEKS